jgi:hypothetical protein
MTTIVCRSPIGSLSANLTRPPALPVSLIAMVVGYVVYPDSLNTDTDTDPGTDPDPAFQVGPDPYPRF